MRHPQPFWLTIIRSVLFNVVFYTVTLIMMTLHLPMLALPKRWLWPCVRIWQRMVFFFLRFLAGIKLKWRGLENIPAGPVILACKHQSAIETLLLSYKLNDPAFVLKNTLLQIPLFGWYMHKLGMVAIKRDKPVAALRSILRQSRAAAEQGREIIIFPEGTRQRPGESAPYKPGVFEIYKTLKAPCVPVALNSGLFWPKNSLLRYSGELVISFLPPLAPGLDREEFQKQLAGMIEAETNTLLCP